MINAAIDALYAHPLVGVVIVAVVLFQLLVGTKRAWRVERWPMQSQYLNIHQWTVKTK